MIISKTLKKHTSFYKPIKQYNDMNYSFLELQNQYKIIIPQIQRDYAQGRKDINNDKIKSYDFILKIIEVLTKDKPALNLDFVYGYTKKIAENQTAFIPLDGQQRLTTLWLLHWYLSPKKEIEQSDIKMASITDEVKKWLNNFTYETRNSSTRFCEELTEEYLPVSGNVCATIKDANWFMASWLNDPTVVSMLNMIEAIQIQDFDKRKAWENLTENRKITFDYIDIKSDEFKLTDELYIKMNSRGKPLTSFENFKAQFSEILSAEDTDYADKTLDYQETRITFQKYFAFKIDSIWTDLFWSFVMKNEEKIQAVMQNDKTVNKDESPISYCFMNFFVYVAQMCYFKDNLNKIASDFKKDFSVFKKKENALFLFNTLDFFYKISIDKSGQNTENINTFFENLFQKGKIEDSYKGQVRLFDEKEVNLFERCLLEGNSFDNRYRIILYCLVSYAIKYNLKEVNSELRYNIRVIRNLLQATRQKDGDIKYSTNVRINSFGKYWKLFNKIQGEFDEGKFSNVYELLLKNIDNKETDISDDALNNEKEKAQIIINNISNQVIIEAIFKLEEYKHFGGLIHNLNPQKNIDKLIAWSKSVREIWNCSDELIVASLIACNFGGFNTKKDFWFWGQRNDWNKILVGQNKVDNNLSEPIILLLNKYDEKKSSNSTLKPQKILEEIIWEFLNSLTNKNWQYYFCKYKENFLKNSNYYWWNTDEFEHEILGSTGNNPLLSYHINPYVKAVSNRLDNTICQEKLCYERYRYESYLILENNFKLYSKQDGWHIIIPEDQIISDEIRKKYDINEKNIFSESNEKDRIEVAVDFCKEFISNS